MPRQIYKIKIKYIEVWGFGDEKAYALQKEIIRREKARSHLNSVNT